MATILDAQIAMPQISVIVPVYNCADTLARAIESAQRQTLSDIEIIIVDDCSTDNSYEIAEGLAQKDPRIKAVRLPTNGGASVARNTALDLATSEWIAVLDSDDWYEPVRLETMLAAARNLKANLICDNLRIYDHVRQVIVEETRHGHASKPTPLTAELLFRSDNPLRRHAIGYVKPMVKSAFLREKNIRYDPVHRSGQDFVFLAEIILNGAKGIIIPDALYVYVHRISPTTRKISPHSRSGAGFVLIVQGCDELMQKYGASMSPAARRALQQRRWIFANRIRCSEMLAELEQKQWRKAARILALNPFIIVLVAATIAKWIYANILLHLK